MPSAWLIRRPGLPQASRKDFPYSFPQRRQYLVFEPGISPEPRIVPPAWMGQRDSPGKTRPPVSNRFGHPSPAFAKVPNLRGSADQYRQFEIGHRAQDAISPRIGTHLRWRQVRARVTVSGKTECHGKDGETASIIKLIRRHTEPCPQPVPGRVRERSPQPMDSRSRRLPRDENRRCRRQPRNRPGTVCGGSPFKHRLAQPAGADFVFETVDRSTHKTQFPRIGPVFHHVHGGTQSQTRRRNQDLAADTARRFHIQCTSMHLRAKIPIRSRLLGFLPFSGRSMSKKGCHSGHRFSRRKRTESNSCFRISELVVSRTIPNSLCIQRANTIRVHVFVSPLPRIAGKRRNQLSENRADRIFRPPLASGLTRSALMSKLNCASRCFTAQ